MRTPNTLRNLALLGFAILATAAPVTAAEIDVDGTILEGTVVAVKPGGVDFEPALGSGTLSIAYEDIDALKSDKQFLVLYGEDSEARGQILGIEDGKLLVGEDMTTAVRVEPATIVAGYEIDGTVSRLQALRSRWRYWTASFDTGFAHSSGTTDTTNVAIGFHSERRKPGTRFVVDLGYLFGTQKQTGESSSTLNNEVHGLLKGEYDLTDWLLAISSFDAEYDEIERLSYRFIPKLGLGYRLLKTDKAFFQLETAPAYVRERFFGDVNNEFFAVSFGAEGEYKLPYSAVLGAKAEYLPAVDDWVGDYLLRSEVSLTMPVIGFVNLKAALADQYDSTPAAGTKYNELQTSIGLSLVF